MMFLDKIGFMFEPFRFIQNLPKLGIGLVIIFVIIGIIMGITMLLNHMFSDKKKEDK